MLRRGQVEVKDPSSSSTIREVEFKLLIDGVGRAWRAEDLYDKQHSLTGIAPLDKRPFSPSTLIRNLLLYA